MTRAIVIGGGIAGLSSAALLARDLLLRWPLATQHPAWHSPDGDAVREMLIA